MSAKDVVDSFMAAWNARDIESILDHMSQDCEYHNMPWEPLRGHDAIRGLLDGFVAGMSSIEFVVHRQVECGSQVMNERTDRFEVGDRWVGLPVMGVFVVADGKITEWRDYFDSAEFDRCMAALHGN